MQPKGPPASPDVLVDNMRRILRLLPASRLPRTSMDQSEKHPKFGLLTTASHRNLRTAQCRFPPRSVLHLASVSFARFGVAALPVPCAHQSRESAVTRCRP